jgi:hypothetical protein
MRKKSLSDKYIEERLNEWADWIRKGCDSGLGFSHRNIMSRLQEEGGVLINGTGPKYPASNPSAEEIECLVKVLATKNYARANLLRIYYLNPIDHVLKAMRNGYKKSQYYAHVDAARQWIKECLSKKLQLREKF